MNTRFISMQKIWYKTFLLSMTILFLVVGTKFSNSFSYAEENYRFLNRWGVRGTGEGEFTFPQVIAIDKSNNLYILDNTGRVQMFDSNGVFIKTIITDGPPRPVDGALDSTGNIYVLSNIIKGAQDNINGTISKYNSNGTFIKEWGSLGTGPGQFNQPLEVEVDSAGDVYVADSWNHRIQKFDSNGTFIKEWGTNGTGKGQFNIVHGLALDSLSNLYVADAKYTFPGNDRIQKFDRNGTFIKEWGKSGKGNGEFQHPMAITVDSLSKVYVADTLNHRIQKFDSNGTFITSWGSLCRALDRNVQVNSSQINNSTSGCIDPDGPGPQGKGDGQFQIPVSVAIDSNGDVYVSDFTSRIQKFTSR